MTESSRREKDLPMTKEFEYVRCIDPNGRSVNVPKSLFGGNLDVASEEVLGGVKASPKSETDTNEVKIDPNTGKLYCPPSEVAMATAERIGGIVADVKTSEETEEVKIDSSTGKAYVKPSSKLEMATSEKLGGVKANPATSNDTQEVHITEDGFLVTQPTTGGENEGVTGVKGNAETSYRKGNVNITPANIGLGNVNNTADSDKSVMYATSSGSSIKATQDANGNVITETYATKTEVSNAETSSEDALNIANEAKTVAITAKNAVATLEGLANTTTAQEILAAQVVQIEENKQNIKNIQMDINDIVANKEYVPTQTSYRPSIGAVLKAGETYTVEIEYNSPTGKLAGLKAHNSNSGTAADTLLSGVYLNKGSATIEYTPSVDVSYWYIEMASDYAATDSTRVNVKVYKPGSFSDLREKVVSLESSVIQIQDRLDNMDSGIELLSDKSFNPAVVELRTSIGAFLKAGKTYRVELVYSIGTGNFVGLKAHNSTSGVATDTIKYDLYDSKGSYTVEYTPSIDVNTWYIIMASNYVYSESTNINIKVYGEVEESDSDSPAIEYPKVKRLGTYGFSLSAGASKSLSTNYARAKSMTCVDIDANGSFESITLDYAGYANITIDGTNIISSYKDGTTVAHGLALSTAQRIAVSFERKTGTRLVVRIIADGEMYVSEEISFFVFGGAKLTNNGSNALHIESFTYCASLIDNDIWIIGDSYMSLGDPNRWPYWIEQWGHGDVYIDGLSGGSSSVMYSSLLADLEMYTPKYILWCLGMNNADGTSAVNSSWLEVVQNVIAKCEEKGITPVLATIPSVPTRNNSFKNEWVRASGYRYVDFAKAVEDPNNVGYWYADMLSSDGVHPSELGAKALAMQVLIDFVEITTK